MRAGLFVDIGNLYYCVGKRFEKKKLDYQKYLTQASKGVEIQRAIAYGSQIENKATGFISCLKRIGFEPKYKRINVNDSKINWNIGLTLDVVQMIEKLDLVILGSADHELVPLVEYITTKGVRCEILACGINRDLKTVATKFTEITEDLLEVIEEKKE